VRTLALGLALALAGAGCGERPPASRDAAPATADGVAPDRGRASLLFVSLDTFRNDAAGCGGDPLARTPHLDRLARTGLQFRAGVTASPLTLPSHTTLLTGLDPPAHGVRDNGTYRLDDAVPTLPEALRGHGFATGAFLGAFPLDARYGLARGFDRYDDDLGGDGTGLRLLEAQRPGDRVVADARRWWATLPADTRWFAWVHLFDAHAPHDAPVPLVRSCGDRPYAADASLADRYLGQAVRAARAAPGDAWVVVLGDHGEGLGDHGEATHGLFVYSSTLHVPAVIWPSPAEPGPRDGTFRALDLPATVFALLGLDPAGAPGGGLPPGDGGEPPRAVYQESLWPLLHHGWAPLHAVEEGRWKYVAAPAPELYDLRRDPGERRNVIEEHPEEAARLAARLEAVAAAGTPAGTVPLDDDARSALESLGYATGGAEPDPSRPDPKSRLPLLARLDEAQRLLSAGRAEEAVTVLRGLAEDDPGSKEVHQTLGIAWTDLGRHEEAARAFQAALDRPPHRQDSVLRFELASAFLRAGQAARAIPPLEALAGDDPENPAVWYNLGVAWDRLGQAANARRAWQRALRVDPGFRAAEQALGGPDGR